MYTFALILVECRVMGLPLVLVVEDDQLIQAVVELALSGGGFEVAIAQSGEEAIILMNGDAAPYAALVTDVNLSGNTLGWEVAKVAREKNPAMPVVYMTGAAGDDWASQGVPNSILLNKPFAPAQLVTAVAQLLNAGNPPSAPA
jgi:CheY-like chemotaxis protein